MHIKRVYTNQNNRTRTSNYLFHNRYFSQKATPDPKNSIDELVCHSVHSYVMPLAVFTVALLGSEIS